MTPPLAYYQSDSDDNTKQKPGGTGIIAQFNKATLPLLLKLADQGYKKTLQENKNYLAGLNVYRGKITFKGVSDAFNLDYSAPSDLLSN